MSTSIRDLAPIDAETTPTRAGAPSGTPETMATARHHDTTRPGTFAAALVSATAAGTKASAGDAGAASTSASGTGSGTKTTGGASAPASSTHGATTGEAPSRPTGEQLQAVPGAPYAKITSGPDAGLYLNQETGNPREGEAFRLEHSHDRTLHVYGGGTAETIEVIPIEPTTPSSGTTTTPSSGTTTPSSGTTTPSSGTTTPSPGTTTPSSGTTTTPSSGTTTTPSSGVTIPGTNITLPAPTPSATTASADAGESAT